MLTLAANIYVLLAIALTHEMTVIYIYNENFDPHTFDVSRIIHVEYGMIVHNHRWTTCQV